VTGSDVAAARAEIGAGPAITPTAVTRALRTMRWPPFECASLPKGIGIGDLET
jgi:hypothetical protein